MRRASKTASGSNFGIHLAQAFSKGFERLLVPQVDVIDWQCNNVESLKVSISSNFAA